MTQPDVLISPNYRLSDFGGNPDIDQKILIFEDRVHGWFLNVAKDLLDESAKADGFPSTHFAVLAILAMYFEMIAQYSSGLPSHRRSERSFCDGIHHVFPDKFSEREASRIYSSLRCSLYHNGFTRGVMVSEESPDAILFMNQLICINPRSLFESISRHFSAFITRLQNPDEIQVRRMFERSYDNHPKL